MFRRKAGIPALSGKREKKEVSSSSLVNQKTELSLFSDTILKEEIERGRKNNQPSSLHSAWLPEMKKALRSLEKLAWLLEPIIPAPREVRVPPTAILHQFISKKIISSSPLESSSLQLPPLRGKELKGKMPGDTEKGVRNEGWGVKKLYLRWSIKRLLGKLDKEDNAFRRKRLVEGLSEKLKRINPQDKLFQSAVDKVREMARLDNNPNVRKSAVAALGESGDRDAGRLLAVILGKDPDPAVKYAAVEALEGIGKTDSETRKVLFETFREILPKDWGKAYDNTNIDIRLVHLRIVLALTGLPLTDEHRRQLDKLLQDIQKKGQYYLPMAKAAIIALSRIHQLNPAVNMLENEFKKGHLSFHPPFAITGRIDEIGLSIRNVIEEEQTEQSRKAAEALCRGLEQLDINPRKAEKIFTKAIQAWFKNKKVEKQREKIIKSDFPEAELASIAEVLGLIGKSEEAVRALTSLAWEDSGYYSISGIAIEALGRIGAKSVVGKLKRLTRNKTGKSSRVIFAWGRIASPRAVKFLTEIIKKKGQLPWIEDLWEEWKAADERGYAYQQAWEAFSLTGRSHRLELITEKIQDHDRDWLSQFIAASIYNLRRDRGQILNQEAAARRLIFLWQSGVKDGFLDSKKKEDYALYSQLIYGLELGRLILGEEFYFLLSKAGVEKKDFLKPAVNQPVSQKEGGITVTLYGLLLTKPTQDDAVLRRQFARRLGIPQEVNVKLEEKGQPIGPWQKAALSTGNYQIPILAYLPALMTPSENKDISLLGASLELDQIFFLLSPGDGYKVVLDLCARGEEFLRDIKGIIEALERVVSEKLSRKNIIVNEEEVLLWLSKLLTRLKELRVAKEDARIYLVDENDKRIWEGLPPAGPGKMPRLGKILTIGSGKIKIYFEGIIWQSIEKVKDIPGGLINLLTLWQFKENLSEITLVHIEDTWRGIEGYPDILNKYLRSFKEVFNPINTTRCQGKNYKGIVENIYEALVLLAEELGPLESIQVYQKLREAGISVLVNGKPLANPLKEGCFGGKFKAGDEITITPEMTSSPLSQSLELALGIAALMGIITYHFWDIFLLGWYSRRLRSGGLLARRKAVRILVYLSLSLLEKGNIPYPRVISALFEALKDKDEYTRSAAERALIKIGQENLPCLKLANPPFSFLKEILGQQDFPGIKGLSILPPKEEKNFFSSPELTQDREFLSKYSPELRKVIIRLLGEVGVLGPEEKSYPALQLLIKTLEENDDPGIREDAARMIDKIIFSQSFAVFRGLNSRLSEQGEKIIYILYNAVLHDKAPGARKAAADALWSLAAKYKIGLNRLSDIYNSQLKQEGKQQKNTEWQQTFFKEKMSEAAADMTLAEALETLGLSERNPSFEEIKKRYWELIKENHPDKHPDNPGYYNKRTQALNAAMEFLKKEHHGDGDSPAASPVEGFGDTLPIGSRDDHRLGVKTSLIGRASSPVGADVPKEIKRDYLIVSRWAMRFSWPLRVSLISAISVLIILMSVLMKEMSSFCLPTSSYVISTLLLTADNFSPNALKWLLKSSISTATSLAVIVVLSLPVLSFIEAMLSQRYNYVKINLVKEASSNPTNPSRSSSPAGTNSIADLEYGYSASPIETKKQLSVIFNRNSRNRGQTLSRRKVGIPTLSGKCEKKEISSAKHDVPQYVKDFQKALEVYRKAVAESGDLSIEQKEKTAREEFFKAEYGGIRSSPDDLQEKILTRWYQNTVTPQGAPLFKAASQLIARQSQEDWFNSPRKQEFL
ncbi:MAG TPA: hypothetical protein DCL49_08620, partial [Candidatus Omnitrophica bacterium]|nr:hypothetical protein [Candidatus Omnitrophota bacterium]